MDRRAFFGVMTGAPVAVAVAAQPKAVVTGDHTIVVPSWGRAFKYSGGSYEEVLLDVPETHAFGDVLEVTSIHDNHRVFVGKWDE